MILIFLKVLRSLYAKQYEVFLQEKSEKFNTWKHFEQTKSLAHRLRDFGISSQFRKWCQSHLCFLDTSVSVQNMISTCHAIANVVINNMRRMYDKRMTGSVMMEILKLAVRALIVAFDV